MIQIRISWSTLISYSGTSQQTATLGTEKVAVEEERSLWRDRGVIWHTFFFEGTTFFLKKIIARQNQNLSIKQQKQTKRYGSIVVTFYNKKGFLYALFLANEKEEKTPSKDSYRFQIFSNSYRPIRLLYFPYWYSMATLKGYFF